MPKCGRASQSSSVHRQRRAGTATAFKPYSRPGTASADSVRTPMDGSVFVGDAQAASSSSAGKVLQESNVSLLQSSLPHFAAANGQLEQHCSPFRQLPGGRAPMAPHLVKLRPFLPHLPESHSADSLEMWNSMCWKEVQYGGDRSNTLDTVETAGGPVFRRHPEITPRMRAILFDWMSEVSEVYKLHRTTYYMAADYVDRYLMADENVPKRTLQLIGITALFTASKIEEIYPPKVSEFAYVCDGACQEYDIIRMEIALTQKLEWRLSPMTAVHWLAAYLQNVGRCQQASGALAACTTAENTPPPLQAACASSTSQPEHARRNLFAATASPHCQPKQEAIYVSAVDRTHFLRLCELLDLCLLDDGWTGFTAGELAASALCCMSPAPERVAELAAGLDARQLHRCVAWMRPFARWAANRPDPMTLVRPHMDGVPLDDQHNIQLHTVDAQVLTKVQEDHTPLFADSESMHL